MAGTGSSIDLNADVGQSFGRWQLGVDDSALMPLLTSANVACGFHAGDALTLRRTVTETAEHVAVGAQVSYRDLAGFGRRDMSVEPALAALLLTYPDCREGHLR